MLSLHELNLKPDLLLNGPGNVVLAGKIEEVVRIGTMEHRASGE